MSVAKSVRQRVMRMRRGKPFVTRDFSDLGSRSAVDQALSRLVREGVILRVIRGMFARPTYSPYIKGPLGPGSEDVVRFIAKQRGETLQMQGGDAALHMRLSNQVPMGVIFHTSGPSRVIKIGNSSIWLKHVCSRKLQLVGTHPGMALTALWSLGRTFVNDEMIKIVRDELSAEDYATLQRADMPVWMAKLLAKGTEESGHA